MIPRLNSTIAHSHDTKLPGEYGEDMATNWGTRPSPMMKPFGEDPGDALTRGWGNISKNDLASTCGWRNRPNPKKDLALTYSWGNRSNP